MSDATTPAGRAAPCRVVSLDHTVGESGTALV